MNVLNYIYNLVDIRSGQKRTATSLIESGGWFFKQVDTYSEATPLVVNAGERVKLTIPVNDTGFVANKYFELSYDSDDQKFTPNTQDDVYTANIRMKIKPSTQAGYLSIRLEVPNVTYNPINAASIIFNKGANEEHFFSPTLNLFIGEDAERDGIEVWVEAFDTNVEIYDYSFLITRLYSNKGNG